MDAKKSVMLTTTCHILQPFNQRPEITDWFRIFKLE
jgi:hypothetical protein